MFGLPSRSEKQLNAARSLIQELALKLNNRVSVRLWDGSVTPLGTDVDPNLVLSISGPGVVGSLLRRPTSDNLLKHYALGHIDFHGADIHTFISAIRVKNSRKQARKLSKMKFAKSLLPFLFEPASNAVVDHEYRGDITGRGREQAENLDFVQFHYDVSNEFYELFLDREMVYTCAYFANDDDSLDQAQFNKMDMVCRKLQLQPGERFLDIGFGWGGLLCHAAKHYGVRAHGITLSEEQLAYTQQKINRLGLQKMVTVEVCDYANVEGTFDKVASICMYEHVGIDNLPSFMQKVSSLMTVHGRMLLQGIMRPGKADMKAFRKMNAERKLLAKHIFPGAELDHLGHMIQSMESAGFEVADVEGWRNHYIRTCKIWSQRLYERREDAIRCVGAEKYRMWLLYLVGCSLAFENGGARLYQILVEKAKRNSESKIPWTRDHLYGDRLNSSTESDRNAA